MVVDRVIVGILDTNTYILSKNNKVLIIDPGADKDKIINKINNKEVVGVLITHFHDDHIGALEDICNYYHVNYYSIHNLKEGINNLDVFKFEVIYTPGHRIDSVCYYFREYNMMFVGDFIFKDGIGRADLPYGSEEDMHNSINKILKYDDNIILYPGHGDYTSLGSERNNLLYFSTRI